MCKYYCETLIKELLVAPTTAKFCSFDQYEFTSKNSDGTITAKGHVDAQNGFGAMIRTTYYLTFDYNTYTPKKLKFGNQEINF